MREDIVRKDSQERSQTGIDQHAHRHTTHQTHADVCRRQY